MCMLTGEGNPKVELLLVMSMVLDLHLSAEGLFELLIDPLVLFGHRWTDLSEGIFKVLFAQFDVSDRARGICVTGISS